MNLNKINVKRNTMKILLSISTLLLLLSCSNDNADDYPKTYIYERTVNSDPLSYIVNEEGDLDDLTIQGGFQQVMEQYETGFVDVARDNFYFEEFTLLNENNIEITISSMDETMTNQFSYTIEGNNLIIPDINTDLESISVCYDVIVSISAGGINNSNSVNPYGILINGCEHPDSQSKIDAYFNSFVFNPMDTLGLLRYTLTYTL